MVCAGAVDKRKMWSGGVEGQETVSLLTSDMSCELNTKEPNMSLGQQLFESANK